MPAKQNKRGTNPNSLKNLSLGGRTPRHEENKKGHEITVTDTAWEGLKALAHDLGFRGSVSELMEQAGRGLTWEFGDDADIE